MLCSAIDDKGRIGSVRRSPQHWAANMTFVFRYASNHGKSTHPCAGLIGSARLRTAVSPLPHLTSTERAPGTATSSSEVHVPIAGHLQSSIFARTPKWSCQSHRNSSSLAICKWLRNSVAAHNDILFVLNKIQFGICMAQHVNSYKRRPRQVVI
jgi:hypothetical protein